MAKERINGEGTLWYAASEKRYRAQYPTGKRDQSLNGRAKRDVELKPRVALAKSNSHTMVLKERVTLSRVVNIILS